MNEKSGCLENPVPSFRMSEQLTDTTRRDATGRSIRRRHATPRRAKARGFDEKPVAPRAPDGIHAMIPFHTHSSEFSSSIHFPFVAGASLRPGARRSLPRDRRNHGRCTEYGMMNILIVVRCPAMNRHRHADHAHDDGDDDDDDDDDSVHRRVVRSSSFTVGNQPASHPKRGVTTTRRNATPR